MMENNSQYEVIGKVETLADVLEQLKAAQVLRKDFGMKLLEELIQHHLYNLAVSEEWKTLVDKRETLRWCIENSSDAKELKRLLAEKEEIENRLLRISCRAAYLGAISDWVEYPETMDEIYCLLGGEEKSQEEEAFLSSRWTLK